MQHAISTSRCSASKPHRSAGCTSGSTRAAHLMAEGLQPALTCMMPMRLLPRASQGASSTTPEGLRQQKDASANIHSVRRTSSFRTEAVFSDAAIRQVPSDGQL